jgi:hypothetical protein
MGYSAAGIYEEEADGALPYPDRPFYLLERKVLLPA